MEPTPARPDPYYGPVAAVCAVATLVAVVLAIGLLGLGWTREVRPGEWDWVPPALIVVLLVTPVAAAGGLVCGWSPAGGASGTAGSGFPASWWAAGSWRGSSGLPSCG